MQKSQKEHCEREKTQKDEKDLVQKLQREYEKNEVEKDK